MPLETVNISPRIGVEIKADAATMLSGAFAAEIRKLLDQRGVIVVRDLHLAFTGQVLLPEPKSMAGEEPAL